MTATVRLALIAALGVLVAACDRENAAPPSAADEAAAPVAADEPRPAEGFTTDAPEPGVVAAAPTAAAPVVIAPNVPNHDDRRIRKAIAEIPASVLGGPVDIADEDVSREHAFKALYRHVSGMGLPVDSFYRKYEDEVGGYRYYMFFGVPKEGEGLYVHVRVFPDGRAEIID
jgi:hypothetical protein